MSSRGARPLRLILLSLAVAVAACGGPTPVEEIRLDADHAASLGDHAAAAAGYERIVARYPGDWRAQYELGLCRLELGELAAARRSLEVAASLRPRDPAIADALAEAMFRQGDEDRLFAFLRERVDRTQSVRAYLRQARYAMESGDMDTAKTALETALAFDRGRTVEPLLVASAFAEHVGEVEEAVAYLRRARSIDPADERVRRRLVELGEAPGPSVAGAADR